MCKILNTRGPVAMEDDKAGDAKSGSFTPTPTPTHMEGAFAISVKWNPYMIVKGWVSGGKQFIRTALFVMFADAL